LGKAYGTLSPFEQCSSQDRVFVGFTVSINADGPVFAGYVLVGRIGKVSGYRATKDSIILSDFSMYSNF